MIDQRIFERAVEAAQARFPSGVWDRMPAGEKVEAIQAEMRRIDPESMEGLIPLNAGPTGTASASAVPIPPLSLPGWFAQGRLSNLSQIGGGDLLAGHDISSGVDGSRGGV